VFLEDETESCRVREPRHLFGEVVAKNLRRLRDDREWTREDLVKVLAAAPGPDWSEWRIIDLEGARTGHPPAAARWSELVALTIAMDVTLWDLVLPVDPSENVRVVEATQEFELRGKSFSQQSVRDIGRYQLGQRLSGFPPLAFTKGGAEAAKKTLTTKNIAMSQINERQDEIERLMTLISEEGDEIFGTDS
jgi:hypothetical protein